MVDRDDWPVHQPGPAYEAPIPGLHWYGGCEPGYPRVNPQTGRCESCGETACVVCGREACPDHRLLVERMHALIDDVKATLEQPFTCAYEDIDESGGVKDAAA